MAFVTADPIGTATLRAGLRSGGVSLARALRVAEATSGRDPQAADAIAERVLAPCRDGSIPSQALFAARLGRRLARHPVADPTRARRDAITAQDAGGRALADGSGEVTISGDGPRVAAAVCRIDTLARAARATGAHGGRTLAQLRSDIALDLLLYGQPPGVQPPTVLGRHARTACGTTARARSSFAGPSAAASPSAGVSAGSADPPSAVVSADAAAPFTADHPSGSGTGLGVTASEVEPVAPVVGAYPPARVQLIVSLATLLGVNDGLGEIPGFGYVSAEQARDIAHAAGSTWRRLVTDPVTGALLGVDSRSYTPPPRLRAHVTARDLTCRGPGCQIPATSCDLDHDQPWPTGPTTAANLTAKHRRHHNLKTTGLWHATHDPAADALTWTTLAALTYMTHPHDYSELDDPPVRGAPPLPTQAEAPPGAFQQSADNDAQKLSPADDLPPF